MEPTLYEEWLLGEGLQDSTILNYRGKLERVFTLVAGQGWELETLSASQIRWVADQFPQTKSTLAQVKACLNHYYRMVGVHAPLGAIRIPKRGGVDDYKGLEDDAATAMEAAAVSHKCKAGLAVLTGLYLGLRRGEMVGLLWSDFDERREWVDVLGKGRKRRWLPVHPNLQPYLRGGEGHVFPGRFSGHVNTGSVYLWVQKIAEEADLGRVHPHALRHTCLTRLYEETGDIRLVQEFAGHSDPMTTARYSRVSRNRLRAAVDELDYRAA